MPFGFIVETIVFLWNVAFTQEAIGQINKNSVETGE